MVLAEIRGLCVSTSMWPVFCVYVWASTAGVELWTSGIHVFMCWPCTILGSRGNCCLCICKVSTSVFSLISQEGSRIRPFVLVVFELVWCGSYLYWSICKYIHTEEERKRETVYIFKMQAQPHCCLDIRLSSCNSLASGGLQNLAVSKRLTFGEWDKQVLKSACTK